MCTWSNTQNLVLDKLDWELTNQEADKHYSTPLTDHTLGSERGNISASLPAKVSLCALCNSVQKVVVSIPGTPPEAFPCNCFHPGSTTFSMFLMCLLGSLHVFHLSAGFSSGSSSVCWVVLMLSVYTTVSPCSCVWWVPCSLGV